ncbi:transposase [Comamonas sp. Tr-654]|uniref:transposase n=1 Tax=Comamonas sp. Tr-654 TaxID=2608341 RepID=UPI00351B1B41
MPCLLEAARYRQQDCHARSQEQRKLGKHRWVVERTHGCFAGYFKLRIRFERRQDIHEALLKLAAAIIYARFVGPWCYPL